MRRRRSWRLASRHLTRQATRIATTAEALVASPVFFHGKQIVVRRDASEAGPLWQLANTAKPIFVFWKERPSLAADSEMRGEFWDLGRLQRDDSRFSAIDFTQLLEAAAHGQWPPRDQVFVIMGATTVESPLPAEPTLRAVAIAPDHYANRAITVSAGSAAPTCSATCPQPAARAAGTSCCSRPTPRSGSPASGPRARASISTLTRASTRAAGCR